LESWEEAGLPSLAVEFFDGIAHEGVTADVGDAEARLWVGV